jgi:hypothetical protein
MTFLLHGSLDSRFAGQGIMVTQLSGGGGLGIVTEWVMRENIIEVELDAIVLLQVRFLAPIAFHMSRQYGKEKLVPLVPCYIQ